MASLQTKIEERGERIARLEEDLKLARRATVVAGHSLAIRRLLLSAARASQVDVQRALDEKLTRISQVHRGTCTS